jgi:hypothetical protein
MNSVGDEAGVPFGVSTGDGIMVTAGRAEGVVWDVDEQRSRSLVVLRMPSWSAGGLARVLVGWSAVCAATGSSEGEGELAAVLARAVVSVDGDDGE